MRCTDCGLLCNACIPYHSTESQDCYEKQIIHRRNSLLLADKDEQFIRNLCCYLADRIQELGDIIEEQSRQLLMDNLAIGRASGEENGWIPAEDVRQHFTERI